MALLVTLSAGSGIGFTQSQPQPPAEQSTSGPPLGDPVHLKPGVTNGILLKRVNPEYPIKARRKGIQGTVVLHAVIGKEGDIVGLTMVSGDPLLVKAALKAVKQWKYQPYLLEGKPVEVDTEITVNFALSN